MSAATSGFVPEIRFVLRALRRRPGFALTAILTLAIGIAASTTVYSVVNALLIRPLPYANSERLVAISPGSIMANREIQALRQRSRSLDQIALLSPGWLMALTGFGEPRQLNGAKLSGNMLELLGVSPQLGRSFGMEAEIPGNDAVAVLGYDLWQSAFKGDSSVIGRSIQLDGSGFTVLGVMPAGFQVFGENSDLWVPMAMDQSAMSWTGATSLAYGRLQPGTPTTTAAQELGGLFNQIRQEFQLRPDWGTGVPLVGLKESIVGGSRPMLLVLMVAVGFLLLIACANVANLLLVRTSERHQELAVRAALGASPLNLARVLLGECVALALAGGLAGIGMAYAGVKLVRTILPSSMPRVAEISLDLPVVAIAVVATFGCAMLFGLVPLLQGRSVGLADSLRRGKGTTGRAEQARATLVAVEVALAVVLTAGAALMTRTMAALTEVDPGLRTDHLLTMKLQPSGLADDDARRVYWRSLLETIRAVPGVTSAGTILHLPTSGRSWHADIAIDGRPLDPGTAAPRSAWQSISSGYFETAGVPLIRGRQFTESDRGDSPKVILINSAFAEKMFPGQDPIGVRIKAGNATANEWATIVGVVGSVRHDSLNVSPGPEVYVPYEQKLVGANSLVIRTAVEPLTLAGPIREAIWSINRDVPISEVRTMGSLYSASLQKPRMVLTLLGAFSAVGVLLGAIGIYGVVSYSVRQKRREIGIRVALGALPQMVIQQVVRMGLRQAMAGLIVGIPAALILSRFLRGLVYGVSATDPVSLIAVSLLLLLVGLGASLLPARSAASVDPTIVLKE